MPIKINGSTSGSVTLAAPATGSDVTLTLPTTSLATEAYVDARVPASAWTTYTPTWTNLTVGNGTNEGRYTQIGKLVVARIRFTLGSTSSVGTAPTFSLPVTSSTDVNTAGQTIMGRCSLRDTGTGTFGGTVNYSSSTTAIIFCDLISGTRLVNQDVTATTPFTWANTDIIHATITYEAA